MKLLNNLYEYETNLINSQTDIICGVDEVGRGCIAGPLVVCAVILPKNCEILGLNDSKKLTEKKREELYEIIIKTAISINTVFVDEEQIEKLNIYQATKIGMLQAIHGLKVKPQHVLIDAMPLDDLNIPNTSIIKGDSKSLSIAAASVIAKVTRDRYMKQMANIYKDYGFEKHKGYCTKFHVLMLEKLKPCKIHRKTFYPVTKYQK